jgi:hypothetical protein
MLAVLPHHESLLESLCAYDLVGFQTIDDLTAFHEAVVRGASGEVLSDGRVRATPALAGHDGGPAPQQRQSLAGELPPQFGPKGLSAQVFRALTRPEPGCCACPHRCAGSRPTS